MTNTSQPFEQFLRRDRLIVIASLFIVTVLAWLYLVSLAAEMSAPAPTSAMSGMDMSGSGDMAGMGMSGSGDMGGMDMSSMGTLKIWSLNDALLTFTMWTVMMVGMMTPSAAPVVLLYTLVARKQHTSGQPFAPAGVFYLGYVAVWTLFSAVATLLQLGLEQVALISPMLVSVSPVLTGLFLITAGVYQWLPGKSVCLRHCRSPVEWLSRNWHSGIGGAFRMGFAHGLYCLGCCWALMLLLFVGGIMNLLWLAAIAALVLVEKVMPAGRRVGLAGGVLLAAAGVITIL